MRGAAAAASLALLSGLLVGGAALAPAALADTVATVDGECPGLDARVELNPRAPSVSVSAPAGQLVAAYCVRTAGESAPAERVTLAAPAATLTISHSSGKAIRYYTVDFTPAPAPAASADPTPTPTPTPEASASPTPAASPEPAPSATQASIAPVAPAPAEVSPTAQEGVAAERRPVPAEEDGFPVVPVVLGIGGLVAAGAAGALWWVRRRRAAAGAAHDDAPTVAIPLARVAAAGPAPAPVESWPTAPGPAPGAPAAGPADASGHAAVRRYVADVPRREPN